MSSYMDTEKFLAEYVYEVEKDFDVDGTPASWASTTHKSAHRYWDDEDDKTELRFFDDDDQNPGDAADIFAVSHDNRFIAGCRGSIVGVFDVQTKQSCMQFKGLVLPCVKLLFRPALNESGGYTLVIETSNRDEDEEVIIFLELDRCGHKTSKPVMIDVEKLLKKSLDPVVSELKDALDVPSTSPLIEVVHRGYSKTLQELRAGVESSDLSRVEGRTSSFSSSPFSIDGQLFLYLIQNESTQSRARPSEDLPKVVVYDIVGKCQKHVLGGHEDAIMWTAFSPNGQYVATAAWDGTFRIFGVSTGDCKQVIGPTGGQCWSGAWSPDSKHLLVCGMTDEGHKRGFCNKTFVAVYSAETAEQVNRFKHERLRRWVRRVAWSPKGEIAIVHEDDLWIWEPFSDTTISSFRPKVEDRMMEHFAGASDVQWVNGGDMLLVHMGDGTIEMWNRNENTKLRLQRPRGAGSERRVCIIGWIEEKKMVWSLSNDGFMRSYHF